MRLLPRGLGALALRAGAAAQNALEVARFGGLNTGEEPSPYTVVERHRTYRLRHYFPDMARQEPDRPAIVLVPPLMLSAEVWDVAPASSPVAHLAARGIDPWVVDFGAPEHEEGGLERDLADHVVAVSEAIDRVRKETGRDVHLAGYSQGGMFAYQAAAYRRGQGLTSLITFGSPVDTREMIPLGLPAEPLTGWLAELADLVFSRQPLPAWLSRFGFKLMFPLKTVRSRVDFLRQLHNREALVAREGQRRFLEQEGWVAWPGPALIDFLRQFIDHNRMLSGGFTIQGKTATLADIDLPVLTVFGDADALAPPPAVRAMSQAAPSADVYELMLSTGHFGLVIGSRAVSSTWPAVAGWMAWHEGTGHKPEGIASAPPAPDLSDADAGIDLAHGVGLAVNVATDVTRSAVRAARRSTGAARNLLAEALTTLPRLARLDHVAADTRISLGLVLDEQAETHPDEDFFLFEERGHTYADAKRRIDAVVRGLISAGIRQGDHVGVLMHTRPSGLALVAAVSRLGGVSVLLRPDGEPARELDLGEVTTIVADPEHAAIAAGLAAQRPDLEVLVLGGGGEPRDLGLSSVTDLERVDPEAVELPAWYDPNPGQARDLAFILFTGSGERVRANRITNRRWSLSAYGTASSARMEDTDTVYAPTPMHHPATLLTAVGGAVAAGARLALTPGFEPSRFWEEIRRYGVTVVSYTWTMCQHLLDGEVHAGERHHPIRLFLGSGMPTGVWERVLDRFEPARVLEFYASTEGEAVLANVAGDKVGAKGRPVPGSAEVVVARYDLETGRLVIGPDGFAQPCADDEVGILLARVDRQRDVLPGSPLRGVFETGDSWVSTGDLFRRDADGDHWLVDQGSAVIRTSDGPVASIPVEDALYGAEAVRLAAVYGVPGTDGAERVVAAVSLREGFDLTDDDLTEALSALPPTSRPVLVRRVDQLPTATWYRVSKDPLRTDGIIGPGWRWSEAQERYVRYRRGDLDGA